MDISQAVFASGAVGTAALVAGGYALHRVRRSAAGAEALALAEQRARNLPRSLHPVIDPDVCIGSLSCLKSCPEGDILGMVHGAATLVHGENCIGHGRCAAECPVGAIQLVFGTARRGLELPELSEFFESSRPGVFVVGELGGMGLINTAPLPPRSLAGSLVQLPLQSLRSWRALRRAAGFFQSRAAHAEFASDLHRLERLRLQIGLSRSAKTLMRGWRIFHASLAVFLVMAIAAHIGVSLWLGYGLIRLH